MKATGARTGRHITAILAVAFLVGCAAAPQQAEVNRLTHVGFKKMTPYTLSGSPQALRYSGNVGKLVTCERNGKAIRLSEAAKPVKGHATRVVSQESSLDSYVIVAQDGSTEATHIVTIVRRIEDAGAIFAREVETFELRDRTPLSHRRFGTCRAA